MKKLNLILFSMSTLLISGFFILSCGSQSKLGEISGEVRKDFAKTVLNNPESLYRTFVGTPPRVSFYSSLTRELKSLINRNMIKLVTSPLSDCKGLVVNQNADKDNDGFAVDGNYSIDCMEQDQKIYGNFSIQDQNDNLKAPLSGFHLNMEDGYGRLLNFNKQNVDFKIEPGFFQFEVSDDSSHSKGFGLTTLSFDHVKLVAGAEGESIYHGDINNRKEGDKVSVNGRVKYVGSGIAQIPDADFVAEVSAELTMGDCGGGNMVVKSGVASLKDSNGNVVQLVVENCIGTAKYNNQVLPINSKATIQLPIYE